MGAAATAAVRSSSSRARTRACAPTATVTLRLAGVRLASRTLYRPGSPAAIPAILAGSRPVSARIG